MIAEKPPVDVALDNLIVDELEAKFTDLDEVNGERLIAVCLYMNYLTTIVLECVSPAKGHGARKKRMYDDVDKRMLALQKRWAKLRGFDLTDKHLVIGAWEIASGMQHGLYTDGFYAQPERFRRVLMDIGESMVVPFGRTNDLMAEAAADWTLMDTFNDASLALMEQLDT